VEKLFSYGTLRDGDVQRAVFGRTVDTTPDLLSGYRLVSVRVSNWDAAAISGGDVQLTLVPGEGEPIKGSVLNITEEELRRADNYEPKEFKRVQVRLCSGIEAWVYR
jgi:gamma-glutamylcyclotransferase (GGCT)/AIG2-like uncharacterized protein YtfP